MKAAAGIGRPVTILVGLGLLFLALLFWQRERSEAQRIIREQEFAVDIATRCAVKPAEVMALRELLGLAADRAELTAVALAWRRAAVALDADLALLVALGHQDVVDSLLAQAGGDAAKARLALRGHALELVVARFVAAVERYHRLLGA